MARIVVVAGTLDDIVQRTNTRPDLRWSVPSDRDALISLGFNPAWLDGSLLVAVAESDGEIVGYCGFMRRADVRDSEWLVVRTDPESDVIAVEGFVAEAHRGRRLLPDMEGMAARHYANMGCRRMIGIIEGDNQASIKSHARIGAHPVARLWRVRIGNLTIVGKNGAVRHVGWGAKAPYVLTL